MPRNSRLVLITVGILAGVGVTIVLTVNAMSGGGRTESILIVLTATLAVTAMSGWIMSIVVIWEGERTRRTITAALDEIYRLGMISGSNAVARSPSRTLRSVEKE